MTVPVRYGAFDICRVDPEFNGYCYYTPFAPIVTDVEPLVLPYTLTPTVLHFTEGVMPMLPEPSTYARTNLCSTTGIPEPEPDMALSLAPNPASDRFQLTVRIDRPQRVVVSVTNALGAVCSTRRFEAIPDQPLMIDVSELPAATYAVEVRSGTMRQRAMLVVQH